MDPTAPKPPSSLGDSQTHTYTAPRMPTLKPLPPMGPTPTPTPQPGASAPTPIGSTLNQNLPPSPIFPGVLSGDNGAKKKVFLVGAVVIFMLIVIIAAIYFAPQIATKLAQ